MSGIFFESDSEGDRRVIVPRPEISEISFEEISFELSSEISFESFLGHSIEILFIEISESFWIESNPFVHQVIYEV